jgi:hypothetical protein
MMYVLYYFLVSIVGDPRSRVVSSKSPCCTTVLDQKRGPETSSCTYNAWQAIFTPGLPMICKRVIRVGNVQTQALVELRITLAHCIVIVIIIILLLVASDL